LIGQRKLLDVQLEIWGEDNPIVSGHMCKKQPNVPEISTRNVIAEKGFITTRCGSRGGASHVTAARPMSKLPKHCVQSPKVEGKMTGAR